jgi:uncharacterized membrane protein
MTNLKLAACYLFGVPAIYIILIDNKKDKFVLFHAFQALRMWLWFFVVFFLLRLVINLVWKLVYIPYLDKLEIFAAIFMTGYAIYCAKRVARGQVFHIPH